METKRPVMPPLHSDNSDQGESIIDLLSSHCTSWELVALNSKYLQFNTSSLLYLPTFFVHFILVQHSQEQPNECEGEAVQLWDT